MIKIECKIHPIYICNKDLIIKKSFECPNEVVLELSEYGVRFNASELVSAIRKCTFTNSSQIINITCKIKPNGLRRPLGEMTEEEYSRRRKDLVIKSDLSHHNRVVLELDGKDTEFYSSELIEAIERCSIKY